MVDPDAVVSVTAVAVDAEVDNDENDNWQIMTVGNKPIVDYATTELIKKNEKSLHVLSLIVFLTDSFTFFFSIW